MPVETTDKYIRIRARDPGDFEEGSFRTITLKSSKPRVLAVIGKPKGSDKTEIQTYLFPVDEWTEAEAKKWVADHKKSDGATDIEFKECPMAEFKIAGDGPGVLEGYAAVFGNVDRDNEVIAPGAFSRTIPDFKTSGFLCNQHNWKEELGTITDAKEDDRGLHITAEFYSTADAQQVRQRLSEKMARGRQQGMSIGYRVKQAEKRNGARHLLELDLLEVSVVTVPANPQARVSAVKDALIDLDLEWRRAEMRRLHLQQLARRRA